MVALPGLVLCVCVRACVCVCVHVCVYVHVCVSTPISCSKDCADNSW